MAFMFESRFAMRLTRYAVEAAELQHDYFEGLAGPEAALPGEVRAQQAGLQFVMGPRKRAIRYSVRYAVDESANHKPNCDYWIARLRGQ